MLWSSQEVKTWILDTFTEEKIYERFIEKSGLNFFPQWDQPWIVPTEDIEDID